MRRLTLDFQPRRHGLLAWTPALLGAVLLLGGVTLQQQLEGEYTEVEQHLHQAEQQLGTRPRTQPTLNAAQNREQAEKLAQMRSLSKQLQRPWEHLFAMLESLPMDDVALLSLAPDARKGQVKISAEARDLEAMLSFHKRLEASDELHDVSLLNHEIQVKQPERPVQFNLSASWENGDAHL